MPDFSGMSDAELEAIAGQLAPASDLSGMSDAELQRIAGTPARPFLEKLGNFARNVYANPPPSIAGARDIIKGLPAAAQELTWGADPEAAKQAAGTAALGASMGLGFRGHGGTGVFARPIGAMEARTAPALPAVGASGAGGAIEAAGRLTAAGSPVDIPRYLAAESSTVPQIAAAVKNAPWAGQPIVKSAEKLTEQLGAAKSALAPGAATAESAGERAGANLASWVKTRSQEPVSEAFRKVDDLVNPDWGVPLENTANTVRDIIAERANARIPGGSKAADMVMQAIQGPMDYEGLKRLRTYVGEKTPMELAATGTNPAEIKRIYGALTKDLGVVVNEAGGPEAFAAWQEANTLTRLTKLQQSAISKIIGAKGEASPEAVFSKLERFAGSKSSADINRLRLAKASMGADAWKEVGSALINRLGMAPDGKFSPDRFVTAFGNLSQAGRNELFTPQQRAALMDLFIVSKHVQDRITRFSNPSGTARGVFGNMAAGGLLFADPITVITSMVGTHLAAQALSKPAVVRAAANVSRASLSGNPAATNRALAQLGQVAMRAGLISGAGRMAATPQFGGGTVPNPGQRDIADPGIMRDALRAIDNIGSVQ